MADQTVHMTGTKVIRTSSSTGRVPGTAGSVA
jgi:hypothetical protein